MSAPAPGAAERRALTWLAIVLVVGLIDTLTFSLWYGEVSPLVSALLQLFGNLVSIGLIAAYAGVMQTRPSGAARLACGLMVTMLVLQALGPLVPALMDDPSSLVYSLSYSVSSLFHMAAHVALTWAIALRLTGPIATAVAGLGSAATLGMIVASVMRMASSAAEDDGIDAWVFRLGYGLMSATLLALAIWRAVLAGREGTATRDVAATAPGRPIEDWREAVAGARMVRAAAVGGAILAVAVVLLGFMAAGARSPALAIIIGVGGAIGAVILAMVNVGGLARLRNMPPSGDGQSAIAGAWVLGLGGLVTLGAVMLAMAIAVFGQRHAEQLMEAMNGLKSWAGAVGMGTSIALYYGLRRLGAALDAGPLRSLATATLVVTIVLQPVGLLLADSELLERLDVTPGMVTTLAIPAMIGLVALVLSLMTLFELQRAITRRFADSFAV